MQGTSDSYCLICFRRFNVKMWLVEEATDLMAVEIDPGTAPGVYIILAMNRDSFAGTETRR